MLFVFSWGSFDSTKFLSEMQTFLVVLVNSILILLNEVSSSNLKGLDDSFPCGVPEQGIGLIVGGDVAEKGDFPW